MSAPEAKTKKFGSGERKIPHHTEKAPKYYPAEDVAKPKTVCYYLQLRIVGKSWSCCSGWSKI